MIVYTITLKEKAIAPRYFKKRAVYNHWTALVDWTGGLDWWTDTKNHFYASNKTHWPVGLYDASC